MQNPDVGYDISSLIYICIHDPDAGYDISSLIYICIQDPDVGYDISSLDLELDRSFETRPQVLKSNFRLNLGTHTTKI